MDTLLKPGPKKTGPTHRRHPDGLDPAAQPDLEPLHQPRDGDPQLDHGEPLAQAGAPAAVEGNEGAPGAHAPARCCHGGRPGC